MIIDESYHKVIKSMECTHANPCTECAFIHYAYEKLCDTFDIDEDELRAEFEGISYEEYISMKDSSFLKLISIFVDQTEEKHNISLMN